MLKTLWVDLIPTRVILQRSHLHLNPAFSLVGGSDLSIARHKRTGSWTRMGDKGMSLTLGRALRECICYSYVAYTKGPKSGATFEVMHVRVRL